MNALISNISAQRSSEMRAYAASRRQAAKARRRDSSRRAGSADYGDQIVVRSLDRDAADRAPLARVAGRDSSAIPTGHLLGAELDGRLIAAVSTDTGELVADPFTPTVAAQELLATRVAQLRAAQGTARSFRRHGFRFTARPRRS